MKRILAILLFIGIFASITLASPIQHKYEDVLAGKFTPNAISGLVTSEPTDWMPILFKTPENMETTTTQIEHQTTDYETSTNYLTIIVKWNNGQRVNSASIGITNPQGYLTSYMTNSQGYIQIPLSIYGDYTIVASKTCNPITQCDSNVKKVSYKSNNINLNLVLACTPCSAPPVNSDRATVYFQVKDSESKNMIQYAKISSNCNVLRSGLSQDSAYPYKVELKIEQDNTNCVFNIQKNGYTRYATNIRLSPDSKEYRKVQLSPAQPQLLKIKVTITDSKTNNPVPDIKVTLVALSPSGQLHYQTTSNSNGYEIKDLPIGDYRLITLEDHKMKYKNLIDSAKINANDISNGFVIKNYELEPYTTTAKVIGKVTDNEGNPLTGLTVYAEKTSGINKIVSNKDQTSQKGMYSITIKKLDPTASYRIVVEGETWRAILPWNKEEIKNFDFIIPISGNHINGIVRDYDRTKRAGKLIPNVVIKIAGTEKYTKKHVIRETKTDIDDKKGFYEIYMNPGSYLVTTYHPSYETQTKGPVIIRTDGNDQEVNFDLINADKIKCRSSLDCDATTMNKNPDFADNVGCGICVNTAGNLCDENPTEDCYCKPSTRANTDTPYVKGDECIKNCQCSGNSYCEKNTINEIGKCIPNKCEELNDAVSNLIGIPYTGNDCGNGCANPTSASCAGFIKALLNDMGLREIKSIGNGINVCNTLISEGISNKVSSKVNPNNLDLVPGDIISMGGSHSRGAGHVAIFMGVGEIKNKNFIPSSQGTKIYAHSTNAFGSGVQYTDAQQMENSYFKKSFSSGQSNPKDITVCRMNNFNCLEAIPYDGSAGQNKIIGTVINENTGKSIKTASLKLYTDSKLKNLLIETQTNKKGYYEFNGLGTGKYYIKAEKRKYIPESITITFKGREGPRGQVKTHQFRLSTVDSEKLCKTSNDCKKLPGCTKNPKKRIDVINKYITVEILDKYLKANSQGILKDQASIFHQLGNYYGIDPAFAVAVAIHETSGGTNRGATQLNNFFGIIDESGNFKSYNNPQQGIAAFYKLILNNYVRKGQNKLGEFSAPYAYASGYGVCEHPTSKQYDCCSTFNTHCYCCGPDNAASDWDKEIEIIRTKIYKTINCGYKCGVCTETGLGYNKCVESTQTQNKGQDCEKTCQCNPNENLRCTSNGICREKQS